MHKLKTKWWKQKGAKNCKARILFFMYVYLSIFIKCCITQNYLIILKINFWLRKQRACKNQLVIGIGYWL